MNVVKYLYTAVTFEELPPEVTLSISITNCGGKCEGCHSPELRRNIGTELTEETLDALVEESKGISCVLFLGEGSNMAEILKLAERIKSYHNLKAALYSGCTSVSEEAYKVFDYIKVGPYIKQFGPLNARTTNQRLYRMTNGKKEDITYMFWR